MRQSKTISLMRADPYFKTGLGILLFFSAIALISLLYTPFNPVSSTGPILSKPGFPHIFGTTLSGQDLFSQWMYGSQPTLLVALLSAGISAFFGVSVGLAASYFDMLDEPLMRIADIFLVLPVLPLLIVLATFVRPTNYSASLFIGVFSWPWVARSIRSAAISMKRLPYIEVYRLSGVPRFKILMKIFGHLTPLIIANSTFSATGGILYLSYMDYMGVGPVTSYAWGTTLFYAQTANAVFLGAWWWIVPAGISIGILAMAFALIGYSIEKAYRGVTN